MSRSKEHIPITPDLKIAQLLEAYPELDDVLVRLAPAFAKLRNPMLRKTVAKVTSIEQASRIGGLPLNVLISSLRQAAGQDVFDFHGDTDLSVCDNPPGWFDESMVVETIDARPLIEAGEHPVVVVMSRLKGLEQGKILVLITPFVPAPLIDLARKQGHEAWCTRRSPETIWTYFAGL